VNPILALSRRLARAVDALDFAPPVAHVYNPLVYAREPQERYLERYARPGVEAVLLGMNPGPFGMAQTGVPFGEVGLVRGWLGIEGRVTRPAREHPARPIQGFACKRSEVSGARLWGWARASYGSPEAFFERFFVWNYCPLVFLEAGGKNRTPDKLPAKERELLFHACDEALRTLCAHLAPRFVVGIGAFAAARAAEGLAGEPYTFGTVLHPSPASPAANRGWAQQAEAALTKLGLGSRASSRG
jgi:single-strand selective monofunctional uracil DNA glycosylase